LLGFYLAALLPEELTTSDEVRVLFVDAACVLVGVGSFCSRGVGRPWVYVT